MGTIDDSDGAHHITSAASVAEPPKLRCIFAAVQCHGLARERRALR